MHVEKEFTSIIKGETKGIFPDVIRNVLKGLSIVYGKVMIKRNAMYEANQSTKTYNAKIPTISVGNITAGGTGKTPMVQYICRTLLAQGCRPAVLTRGYKGKSSKESAIVSDGTHIYMDPASSGDEPYLLAKSLPQCAVIVGRSRVASAKLGLATIKPDVFVLDDGFQHRQLGRNLDILLIDATNPFGYGYVLPRGILREPLEGLKRASIFILTKANLVSEQTIEDIKLTLTHWAPQTKIVECTHKPMKPIRLRDWGSSLTHEEVTNSCTLSRGTPVLAVSAIGNPKAYTETIKEAGYVVGDEISFGDHYGFTVKDIDYIVSEALKKGIQAIMITEKDAVKLLSMVNETKFLDMNIQFYVLPIEIKFINNEDILRNLLTRVVENKEGKDLS